MTEDASKKSPYGTPIKSLLSADLADEEIARWVAFVFANFSKKGNLTNIRQDMDFIISKKSMMKFHPLWFAPNKLMSGYLYRDNLGFSLDMEGGSGVRDLLALHAAINALEKMVERKEQALLIVPLHASSFYERQTRDLMRHYCELRALPLQRHLVFMLKGLEGRHLLPSDFDNIKSAAGHCRSFIINMETKEPSVAKYASLKPHACGFSASLFGTDDRALFDFIPKYAEACDKLGVRSYLTDIKNKSTMSAAIAAGFSYLEGDAIMPAEDAPKHAEFWGMESVYQQSLGR